MLLCPRWANRHGFGVRTERREVGRDLDHPKSARRVARPPAYHLPELPTIGRTGYNSDGRPTPTRSNERREEVLDSSLVNERHRELDLATRINDGDRHSGGRVSTEVARQDSARFTLSVRAEIRRNSTTTGPRSRARLGAARLRQHGYRSKGRSTGGRWLGPRSGSRCGSQCLARRPGSGRSPIALVAS